MKGNKLIIMGLGFILIAGMFAPLAVGENDSLHVVMTAEDRHYSAGDTITIFVRVYNSGVLADADAIEMFMSTHHNLNNPLDITLTDQTTGVYSGTYTVKASDNYNNLYFFYEVTLGSDYELVTDNEDALVIGVYSIQDTVDVTFSGQDTVPALPGETLTATILVRTGGTPIPITGFTQLYVRTPTGQIQNYTDYDTVRDGVYRLNFTVPGASRSGMYELVAQPAGIGDQDSAYIYVNVMDVWCRWISATTDNTASFEVCIADINGAPVEGADFYIRRDGWPYDGYFGKTNETGRDLMNIPDVEGRVSFTGYALANGLNQTISGAVTNTVPEESHPHDFDVLWEGQETIFEPDTEVTIPYCAYDAQVQVPGRTVYYYVTASGTDFTGTGSHVEGPREVVAAGSVTTSDLGKFEIPFTTPEQQCAIHVQLEIPLDVEGAMHNDSYDMDDDKYYSVWPQNAWGADGFEFFSYEGNLDGDGAISIKVGSFKPEKNGTVSMSIPAELGDTVMAAWGIGEGTLESHENEQEWARWVPAGQVLKLEMTDDGKYEGTFLVPEFVGDLDVTIIAGYTDSDGIPHFDAKTVSPGGGFSWFWIAIIIIIIIVVIVIIAVVKTRM